MDFEQLTEEYEADLQRVRDKIARLKLQETALHLVGCHNDAYWLSGKRLQYEHIERDLTYTLAQMHGQKKKPE